jgi:hypothetical protein
MIARDRAGGGAVMGMQKDVAAKRRFQVRKLEQRIAPKIVQVNGGGHTPNGEANGVPAKNPAGHEPPGQN